MESFESMYNGTFTHFVSDRLVWAWTQKSQQPFWMLLLCICSLCTCSNKLCLPTITSEMSRAHILCSSYNLVNFLCSAAWEIDGHRHTRLVLVFIFALSVHTNSLDSIKVFTGFEVRALFMPLEFFYTKHHFFINLALCTGAQSACSILFCFVF